MASIARQLPSIRFYPIILKREKAFGMFDDYQAYSWIRPLKEYDEMSIESVIEQIASEEIKNYSELGVRSDIYGNTANCIRNSK